MENFIYADPVVALIALGVSQDLRFSWPNYLQMGLTTEHIHQLIRLLQDDELAHLPWDENDVEHVAVYGQMYAWRALTQLQAIEAIPAMVGLLRTIDEYEQDDDLSIEVPRCLGMLGEAALIPCYELLSDRSMSVSSRNHAVTAIEEIGKQHPGLRRACVSLLINVLAEYPHNHEGVNSILILSLAELKSSEAAPLVEKVIREGHSDIVFSGDYDDYLVNIGLIDE